MLGSNRSKCTAAHWPLSMEKLQVRRCGRLQATVRAEGSKEEDCSLEAKATLANAASGQWPPGGTVPFEKETSYREFVRHCVGKVTPWGRVVRLAPFFVVLDGRNLGSFC